MQSATKLFLDIAAERGWTDATQLHLLLDFLEHYADVETFQSYLKGVCDFEDEHDTNATEDPYNGDFIIR